MFLIKKKKRKNFSLISLCLLLHSVGTGRFFFWFSRPGCNCRDTCPPEVGLHGGLLSFFSLVLKLCLILLWSISGAFTNKATKAKLILCYSLMKYPCYFTQFLFDGQCFSFNMEKAPTASAYWGGDRSTLMCSATMDYN